MKYLIPILLILNFFNCQAAPTNFRTVAIVEDQIISSKDLEDRIKLMSLLHSQKLGQKDVLEILIDEILITKTAAKLSIVINEAEIESYLEYIARQTNIENLEQYANSHGISSEHVAKPIQAQFLWQKIIEQTIMPKIHISNKEVQLLSTTRLNFKYITLKDVQEMQQALESVKSCEEMEQITKELGLSPPTSFENVKMGELNKELQSTLKNIRANQISIFQNEKDSYLLIKCTPKHEALRNELFQQKLAYCTQSYLNKLRKEYYISIKQ
jgi:DNA-binding phage protein